RYVIRDGDVVYILKDKRLVIRPVNILRSFKESVFVDKGLTNGDLVIKTPLSGAMDGMLVRLKTDESGQK
ncbi:MAG: efflux RND transporter periplasmic adaptor subunit, partial [Deltaproteobacteria bacterium]|nr:efflux RND transporter periplasmic adaptor subunit [Deltaproteobacteria bacterium]